MPTITLSPVLQSILLLTASNVFMTFAWYAHLRNLAHKPWIIAALVSWGIALFEYLLQVPANRIGYTTLSLLGRLCIAYADRVAVGNGRWQGARRSRYREYRQGE